nr:ATP-binding protein [Saccharicrinis aurantiacus]
MLNNLISNAIKFSEKGKHIHLTVLESGDFVSFKIKDEGPGITEEDQKLMFKLFQKLSARPTNGESSNGLGLSIIKKLTDKLHGQIKVNTKIGEGTEFIIELPKK